MCTLAWGRGAAGLWACFNRDEQRSRPTAEKPALYAGRHGRLAYAVDPEGGGTWLAASQRGFLLALLNHYPAGGKAAHDSPRSRGLLVRDLAGAADGQAAGEELEATDLSCYAPFHLFILGLEEERGLTWDGRTLSPARAEDRFFSTSSHRPEAVVAWRRAWWRERSPLCGGEPSAVAAALKERHPANPAYGVTMDRADARTVSQTLLEMDRASLRLEYWARAPEGPGWEEPEHLVLPTDASV